MAILGEEDPIIREEVYPGVVVERYRATGELVDEPGAFKNYKKVVKFTT